MGVKPSRSRPGRKVRNGNSKSSSSTITSTTSPMAKRMRRAPSCCLAVFEIPTPEPAEQPPPAADLGVAPDPACRSSRRYKVSARPRHLSPRRHGTETTQGQAALPAKVRQGDILMTTRSHKLPQLGGRAVPHRRRPRDRPDLPRRHRPAATSRRSTCSRTSRDGGAAPLLPPLRRDRAGDRHGPRARERRPGARTATGAGSSATTRGAWTGEPRAIDLGRAACATNLPSARVADGDQRLHRAARRRLSSRTRHDAPREARGLPRAQIGAFADTERRHGDGVHHELRRGGHRHRRAARRRRHAGRDLVHARDRRPPAHRRNARRGDRARSTRDRRHAGLLHDQLRAPDPLRATRSTAARRGSSACAACAPTPPGAAMPSSTRRPTSTPAIRWSSAQQYRGAARAVAAADRARRLLRDRPPACRGDRLRLPHRSPAANNRWPVARGRLNSRLA